MASFASVHHHVWCKQAAWSKMVWCLVCAISFTFSSDTQKFHKVCITDTGPLIQTHLGTQHIQAWGGV